MDYFKAKLQVFGSDRGKDQNEIDMLWTTLFNAEIRVLSGLLDLDLATLKSTLNENDTKFMLGFIRSLPLDKNVMGVIEVTDPEDVEKVTKSTFRAVGSLFDNVRSESDVLAKLKVGSPASGNLWKFVERFTSQTVLAPQGK